MSTTESLSMDRGYTLNNLRFADDIAAVSDSQQGLQSVVGRIANTSHRACV